MSKTPRIKRTTEDLTRALKQRIALLQRACSSYDDGMTAEGATISGHLRALLRNSKQGGGALLQQLGLRDIKYFDTLPKPFWEPNVMPRCDLLSSVIVPGTMRKVTLSPPVAALPPVIVASADSGIPLAPANGAIFRPQYGKPTRKAKFTEWWTETVLRDARWRKFSRLELVSHVADTDGSAHDDSTLDEDYMALSRGNAMGHYSHVGNNQCLPWDGPEHPSMRQIAHELLLTLGELKPEYFAKEYTYPAD